MPHDSRTVRRQQRASSSAILWRRDPLNILLVKIRPGAQRGTGGWGIPGGGIEWDLGQTPETAVVIEVKQETGLTFKGRPRLFTIDCRPFKDLREPFNGVQSFYPMDFVFFGEAEDGEVLIGDVEEIEEVAFFYVPHFDIGNLQRGHDRIAELYIDSRLRRGWPPEFLTEDPPPGALEEIAREGVLPVDWKQRKELQ